MTVETHYLLGGRVAFAQNAEGYRAGMDAVFLAAACPIETGEKLLDLGCGAGAASLCVAARVSDIHVTGVEIQPAQAELARQNFIENNFSADIITSDIRQHNFPADHYDHVIINPPYHNSEEHTAPQNEARAAAFMIDDLAAWLEIARRTVKTHGSLTLIHRADALADVLAHLGGFGAIEVIPLWPQVGIAAERIIIRARKGRKTPLQIHPGIALHTTDGGNTEVANNILRNGVQIP